MARCTCRLASLVLVLAMQQALGNLHLSLNHKEQKKNNELEEVIRKKTETAIKKLEHQFKAIYMKYGSSVKKQDEKKAESYLEDLTKVAKHRIEYRIAETTADLGRRTRRSDTYGACKPICRHKCIPECNLACCVPPPVRMPLETIYSMERLAAKKLKLSRKISSTKSGSSDKKSWISKVEMEKGSICKPECQKHCLPSCKFRCCIPLH